MRFNEWLKIKEVSNTETIRFSVGNRNFEAYIHALKEVPSSFYPENRVDFYENGRKVVSRSESATIEQIIDWFKNDVMKGHFPSPSLEGAGVPFVGQKPDPGGEMSWQGAPSGGKLHSAKGNVPAMKKHMKKSK